MRQKLKKTPLWEKAYISLHEEGDVVTVPLAYEGGLSYTTSFSDNQKRSIQGQAKLLLYKSKDGGWKAEVATYIPDQTYSKGKSAAFSGVVLVEDWAGRTINNYLFKEGKHYRFKNTTAKSIEPGGEVQTATGNCFIINWYLCTVDEDGNTLGCEYQYSERVGCDVSGDDPNGGDGASGSTYETSEVLVTKPKTWNVAQSTGDFWKVISIEDLSGKKVASEPQGGHFTKIIHRTSRLAYGSPTFTWEEFAATPTLVTATAASCTVTGKLTIASNGIGQTISNSQAWYFGVEF